MSSAAYEPRRAYRSADDRLLGGVAAGIGEHLGFTATHARLGFLLLAALGGFGAFLYAALWVVLPVGQPPEPQTPGLAAADRSGRRTTSAATSARDAGLAVSLAVLGLGGLLLLQAAGIGIRSGVFWPMAVAGAGLALVWWQTDQSLAGLLAGRRRWLAWLRMLAGAALVVCAIVMVVVRSGAGGLDGVVAALLMGLAGVTLVLAPRLLRMNEALSAERRERIRSQERADMAAHLHDSVLQTLALIQRKSHDATEVSHLARAQERELRAWLFDENAPADKSLAAAVRAAAAEIESVHRVPIEVVTVGDTPVDEHGAALTRAAREAMANAVRHSGAARVDVFVEVNGDTAEVFVRDRGRGFDPGAIAADRQGIRGSVVERMHRHGGRADVHSEPGEGTEVALSLPLTQEDHR